MKRVSGDDFAFTLLKPDPKVYIQPNYIYI